MLSRYATVALMGFASAALANVNVEGALLEVGFSVGSHSNDDDALEKRQDVSCATSVILDLLPEMPTNTAFVSWVESVAGGGVDIPSCTVTVPASFSDDYMDYYSTLTDWVSTVEEDAAQATNCGMDEDEFYLTMSGLCSNSRTIYFEPDATNGTTASTVLPTVDLARETIPIGAAPKNGVFLGLAMTFAGFVATFIAM